jgi:hypothetical protein
MNKFSRNEWLGIGIGFALGFILCLIGVGFWPSTIATPSPDGSGEYQEISRSLGERFTGIAERTFDDPIALYTFVLVAFTALLGFATVRLWFVTKDLVDGAKDTAERQLRAYPGIVGAKIELTKSQIKIGIDVKTFSPTPARKFKWALAHEFREPNAQGAFKKPVESGFQWDMVPRSHSTLYNKDDYRISTDDFLDVIQERKNVIISGRALYTDVFGKRRLIRFRYRNGPWERRFYRFEGEAQYVWVSEWLIPEYFRSN